MEQLGERTCPKCRGLGRAVESRHQKQDPECKVCEGRGTVTQKICRGCGKPARTEDVGILYCGAMECFAKLTPKAQTKGFTTSGYSMDWWETQGGAAFYPGEEDEAEEKIRRLY